MEKPKLSIKEDIKRRLKEVDQKKEAKEKDAKEAEKNIDKMIEREQRKGPAKIKMRRTLVEAIGPEKATFRQIRKLRTEIGKEENEYAERQAQIEVMGKVLPDKATRKQENKFRPLK